MKQRQKRIPPSISTVLSIFCLLFVANLKAQQTELEKKVGKSITLDANKKPIWKDYDTLVLQQKHSYRIQKTDVAPKIDGNLDDAAWKNADIATDFVTNDPSFGKHASFKTEARITYDNSAIYVSFYCYDDEPNKIGRELSPRDNIWGAVDRVMVGFDTYDDDQNGTRFHVTAAGVQADDRVEGNGNNDFSLDLVWDSKVSMKEDGWVAEMKIPYSALRFPKKPIQKWGMQFARRVNRFGEQDTWSPIFPKVSGLVIQWGEVLPLENITPPVRLSFSPYFAANAGNIPSKNDDGTVTNSQTTSINGGMDVKYGINESFTLDMTLVPDFGQVRSDDRRVNLTPFEIVFSENRPFFTEGTDLLNKANTFYSRRVGGQPQKYYEVEGDLKDDEIVKRNPAETQLFNATKISGRTNSKIGIGFFNAVAAPMFATIENTQTGATRRFKTGDLTNYNIFTINPTFKNNSDFSLTSATTLRSGHEGRDANVTSLRTRLRDKKNDYELKMKFSSSNIFEESKVSQNEGFKKTVTTGYAGGWDLGKVSGQFNYGIGQDFQTKDWDPNDLGVMYGGNNYLGSGFGMNYNTFEPAKKGFFKHFNQTNWWFNANHSTRLSPLVYQEVNMNLGFWGQFKNQYWANMYMNISPIQNVDYFEARAQETTRKFAIPRSINLGINFGTDRRKQVYGDLYTWGMVRDFDKMSTFYQLGSSVTWRASNQFSITYEPSVSGNFNDYGYARRFSDDDIKFGRRDEFTVVNSMYFAFKFNALSNLTFRMRHYWDKLLWKEYYQLEENGALQPRPNAEKLRDDWVIDFFNVDLIYTQQVAPGSFFTATFKNNFFGYNTLNSGGTDAHPTDYLSGFNYTLREPHTNTLSLKLIYFVDYLNLKSWNRKKKSMVDWQQPSSLETARRMVSRHQTNRNFFGENQF